MGGVPALLLVIAAGITYGWQPDQDGGVEYIIQVPPDQVERLQRTGEITSVIDPQVRGHVSRVIIKVGNDPLPREMPSQLRGTTAALSSPAVPLAMSDSAPLPIPEMDNSGAAEPLLGESPASGQTQAVMKPQTNSTTGTPGFGFPPPSTLQTSGSQVDQAGRPITSSGQGTTMYGTPPAGAAAPTTNAATGAAGTSSGTIRIPPPPTRTPSSSVSQPPSLYGAPGAQNDFARTRSGGPTTDPTTARDNTWRDYPSASATNGVTATSGAATTGSNTNSLGMVAPPPENPFKDSAASSTASSPSSTSFGTQATSGLAPGDTYGKMPSGINFAGDAPGTNAANSAAPNTRSTASGPYAAPATTTTGRNSASPFGTSPTNGSAAPPSNVYRTGGATAASANAASNNGPDPLLTPAQVQAGAWSMDSYGRVYDRHNRLLERTSTGYVLASGNTGAAPPASGTFRTGNAGFTTPGTGTHHTAGQQITSTLGVPSTGTRPTTGNSATNGLPAIGAPPRASDQPFGSSGRATLPSGAASTRVSNSGAGLATRGGDPPSLSDRDGSRSTSGEMRREVVAPQPLFNGLLLVSLVANVYLIFWLKNLRLQFRDLVAAKRVAANASAQ